jgi:hypothetical protein
MSSVRAAVRALLDEMDAVCKNWPELTDTEVRGAMREDITDGFIDPKPGFVLPDDYGLSTPEGSAAVRAALARFFGRCSIRGRPGGFAYSNGAIARLSGQRPIGSRFRVRFVLQLG